MTKHFLVFSLLAMAIGAGLLASAQDRQDAEYLGCDRSRDNCLSRCRASACP